MGREGGRWRVKGERWQAIKRPINLLNECSSCGGFSETCILLPGSSLSASSSHTTTHSHAIPTHSYNHTPFSVAATSDTHRPPTHSSSPTSPLHISCSHTHRHQLTHTGLLLDPPHTLSSAHTSSSYIHTHTHTHSPTQESGTC